MMNKIGCILAGLMVTLLTSCSLFSPMPAGITNSYVLNKVPQPVTKRATHHASLLITQPMTDNIYNTHQMVYSVRPYQISYFSKNRWVEPPTVMLQYLLVQTLQKTHYFYAVSPAPVLGSYDFVLNTQLVELRQVFVGNHSSIHLKVRAQIVNVRTSAVVASKEFSVIESAPYATPYGGVIAANDAMARVLKQIAYFCLHNI